MVGIVGFIYQEQVRTDLKLNLNQTFMSSYKINEEKTEAIDYLQDQVKYSLKVIVTHKCI